MKCLKIISSCYRLISGRLDNLKCVEVPYSENRDHISIILGVFLASGVAKICEKSFFCVTCFKIKAKMKIYKLLILNQLIRSSKTEIEFNFQL